MEYEKYEYYKEVCDYLKFNQPLNKFKEFLNNVEKAEKETFNKLLVSIIREKLLPFLKEYDLMPNEINKFQFQSNENCSIKELSFKVLQVYGFDFFTFENQINYSVIGTDTTTTTITINNSLDLIELLKENPQFKDIDQYKAEIVNSILNMGLISTLSNDILNKIKNKSNKNGWKYLSDYTNYKSNKHGEDEYDKFLFYDQIHLNGHHIHPCFKIRLGLNCNQVIQYSYELKKEIPIKFIALHKSVARFSMMDEKDNPSNYFMNLFSLSIKKSILNYFNQQQRHQLNINDYIVYPMFPFQISDTFPKQFKNELDNGTLLILPDSITVPSFPTSSLRNLIPVYKENKNPPHIKYSVPIQTTNFVRFMPNDFIKVGTSVSNLLTRISEIEQHQFKDKVAFLNEMGGIYHCDESSLKYQNFAVIWKENCNLFKTSELDQPISSCSLFNKSPISNDGETTTILGQLIKEYYDKGKFNSMESSIRQWFGKYIKLLLEPNLILLSKYGVSLESHLQNCVIIYVNGDPKLLILKDWSGIVVKTNRLLNHSDLINPSLIESIPNLIKLADLDFYKMFSHSILHNNICQIIIGIVNEFSVSTGITEESLWFDTYNCINSIFSQLVSNDNTLNTQINDDKKVIFGKQLKCKALTGMRLATNNQILLPFNVINPLNKFIV